MAEMLNIRVRDLDVEEFRLRGEWDEAAFRELVLSVERDGILVPILVRKANLGFEVIAGHRRVAAARQAGLDEVPAYVRSMDEDQAMAAAFAENLCRHDLTPVEEAAAVGDLMKGGKKGVEDIAKMLGYSVAWVAGRAAMMDWPGEILEVVHLGAMSMAAAGHLAKITDDAHREMLVKYAVEQGATARVTMAWYQSWAAGKSVTNPGEVELPAGVAPVAQLPPHTPCVVCSKVLEMGQMSYQPICSGCAIGLIQMAKERLAGDRRDPDGGPAR